MFGTLIVVTRLLSLYAEGTAKNLGEEYLRTKEEGEAVRTFDVAHICAGEWYGAFLKISGEPYSLSAPFLAGN